MFILYWYIIFINICAVHIYRIVLGDTYVHNIYLEILWCVLEVSGKNGLQYFNLSSGGLQCWVWREVSGRGAVEIELVMLESKLVPSIRNGSYQIHFRWMGDLKSSDPGSEAASSKQQWLKSLESTLLGQMATGARTGRLWWLWTGHGGGFDKKNHHIHIHIWKSGSAASPGPCHWKTPIDSAGVRAATRWRHMARGLRLAAEESLAD